MDVVDLQDNLTQPKQDNETVEGEKIKVENCIEMDGGDYLVEGDALLEDEETFEESLAVSFEGGNSNERNIMQEDILAEPINKSVEVLTSIKTENSQDTSNGMEDNKNDAIQKFTQKRKKENSGWSSDEEFCGFDENVKSETTGVLKKLKKESMELERHENTDLTTTPSTKIIEKRNVGRTVQLTDPIYRKPFEYGWKRELVLRAIPDISKDKGEVYYITPGGKKLRTRSEIHVNLHDDLQLHHFTLAKEALGADPHDEIIRMAKTSSGTPIARRNMTSVSEPIADQSSPVLGKRIPKPKAPKGSSPTPPSFIKGPSKSNRSNSTPTLKKMDSKDIIKQSTTDTDSKINVTPLKSIKPTTTAGKHTTTKTSKTSTSTTVGTPSPSSPSLTTAPVTIQQQQLPSVPMTGDASPVQKRRLTGSTTATGGGGGGISNIQTIQSPIHITQENSSTIITPTQNRITSPFNINNKINSTMLMKTNRPKYGQQLSGSGSASSSGGNMVCSEFSFSTNFFTNVSIGYDILLHTFQYLKVQELLRASCVCRLWNQAGNHSSLWKTVRMKNSQVNDWNGMANTLIKNGTKHLDLRKMLAPKNSDDSWKKFTEIIGNVQNLESIDLCKCSVNVVESLFQTNQNLKIINAVTLKDEELNLEKLSNLKILTELRIKSSIGLNIINLQSIKDLILIRHLSLTSVHSLGKISIDVIGNLINLESLELGECCDFSINFTTDVLPKLIKLERLRLEKGQDNCCTFDILDGIAKMKNLLQLELINFDIRTNFDEHLSNCKNLKKLLLIPTYVSQSATTNQIVLNGVMKLFETLINFTWAVTGELVRVTELYVDTCDSNNKKTKKTLSDCIPVLKPVPGILENTQIMSKRVKSDVPQVEILPLSSVEKILNAALPDTKVKMVIIPYHATWRQNLVDI